MNTPTFEGTPEQQSLAAEVFELMSMQGAFFANNAPIRQTLSNLAAFLAERHQRDQAEISHAIDQALSMNQQVFHREQTEDETVFATSRTGSYQVAGRDTVHTFRNRLYEPENPLPVDDISVVVSTSRPTLTTVEPVFISDYWQEQAGLVPVDPEMYKVLEDQTQAEPGTEDAESGFSLEPETEELTDTPPVRSWEEQPWGAEAVEPVEPPTVEPAHTDIIPPTTPPVEPVEPAELPGDAVPEVVEERDISEPEREPVLAETDIETPAEEPLAEVTSPEPVIASGEHTLLTIDETTVIDLSQPVDVLLDMHYETLEAKLLASLDHDPLQRIVRFGGQVYPESSLANLGKNDLRRIREDILEAAEPLSDAAIIADLYHQRQADYEAFRFSLNYRLSREKDFEFVGVDGAYLWSVRGLPPIGTKRVKAGEMAQLTSYIVEGYDDSTEVQLPEFIQETGTVTRFLTFFEWTYGVLVFDNALSALLPGPLLADQRSAVLRFESPQHFESYLVEVRYPTANRGGWLQGLDDFFQNHLVAGAPITIERTEEPNVFVITYDVISGGNVERILTFDEKKNRFTFNDIEYFSTVDNDLLLDQKRFGKLKNLKAIPTNERRKADMVLEHVFTVAGEQIGTRSEPEYQIDLDSLLVAYSVLRPVSRPYLESLLADHPDIVADESTPGLYSYRPEPEPEEEEEALDDQLDEEEDIAARWGFGYDE